ncbi:MAG: GIY-YIG nuclease family protein [Opitutales bacterium]|nr:GIY-YIG nuclease family protein [Opitutales bacterium]
MKTRWYPGTTLIAICFALWFVWGIPLVVGIILLIWQKIVQKKIEMSRVGELERVRQSKNALAEEINTLNKKLADLGAEVFFCEKVKIVDLKKQQQDLIRTLQLKNKELQECNDIVASLRNQIVYLELKDAKISSQIASGKKRLQRVRELYKSVEHAIQNFFVSEVGYANCKLTPEDSVALDLVSPSVILKLHSMDVKDLRKAFRENEKQINDLLGQYAIRRYTTKANQSIYNLMVIALRAELQNILINLKYEKLEEAVQHVKDVSAKYLVIAGEGNQSIAGTLTKFIGEIEYLFINAVKIEYNYYVKKEQARQEQLALREQMRQEAEERKALAQERLRIEKEERKYEFEIQKINDLLAKSTDVAEVEELNKRALALQAALSDVIVKRDEVAKLQNGKAGNVYIISNLGAFGENMFKIGMTRRLDPQERINELGDASVPFKFDVHSFIFSEDAVALEKRLHTALDSKRVNKVNLRKEFFYTSIDELARIVEEIDSTAEFKRTMVAEEYRQSMSSDVVYTSDAEIDNYEDEE